MDKDVVPERENLPLSVDTVDAPPNNHIYRKIDVAFVIFGIFTFLLDWGFDILTAYKHWRHGDIIWFSFTVVFICVPSFVMTGVSLHWYVKDADNVNVPKASMSRWVVRILFHILQLGPILRYIDSLHYGLISRRHWKQGERKLQIEYYTYMLYEDGDSVFLRLFECFMEAAPQLVLQLYILSLVRKSEYGSDWFYVLCIGCFTSLVSLAWGVTAFARGSRFTSVDKPNISLMGSFVLMLWHLFSISARVTAMVLFASVFRPFLFIFCGVHWLIMVMWLMVRKSLKEMCNSVLGEIGLSFILGIIYIFVFINEKEEDTKQKYIFFYTIFGIENTIMVVVWLVYAKTTVWYYIPGVVFHFLAFILSLILMGIYYGVFHPTLPSICNQRRSQRRRPEMDRNVEEEGEAKAITSQTVM
ncbi:XK-related protein 6-like isoform X1 [Penaeus chinensis]|uniref:XK-related protein 6-like isoform X1 n=2 Tax=Penaeus chinensis TaxID=139456 RepID=UPI001FB72ACC|nr:XK-related protein 6-like isoform X1 [Penaeus chinensis]